MALRELESARLTAAETYIDRVGRTQDLDSGNYGTWMRIATITGSEEEFPSCGSFSRDSDYSVHLGMSPRLADDDTKRAS